MIRDAHIVNDIKKVIYELLRDPISNEELPWLRWELIMGFPESEVFANFEKPVIYLMNPMIVESDGLYQYGGGSRARERWKMEIGIWCANKHGGIEEMNLAYSTLFQFFNQSQVCHTWEFTVTLGAETYAGTTLTEQGLFAEKLGAAWSLATMQYDEHRLRTELFLWK